VASAEHVSAAHTALEAAVGEYYAFVDGNLIEKIDRLHRAGPLRGDRAIDFAKIYARLHLPHLRHAARRIRAALLRVMAPARRR
jgi:hypothetical protein